MRTDEINTQTHIGEIKTNKKRPALQHRMHHSCDVAYTLAEYIFLAFSETMLPLTKLTNKTTARLLVCVLSAKTSKEHVRFNPILPWLC